MLRITLLLASLVAAGTLAASAVAAGSGSVWGVGSGPGGSFAVVAQGGPTGGRGFIAMLSDRSVYIATVDCMIVVGNGAWVVGTLTQPVGLYTQLIAEVVDNGRGTPPDAALVGFSQPTPFDPCGGTVNFSDALPITRGDFVVRAR